MFTFLQNYVYKQSAKILSYDEEPHNTEFCADTGH